MISYLGIVLKLLGKIPIQRKILHTPVCANGMTDLLDKCPVKETFFTRHKQVLLDAQPVL